MSVLDELRGDMPRRRLGALTQRVQDVGHPNAEPLSVFLGRGVLRRADATDNHNELGSDLAKYQLVKPGDLVFNRLRTWQGGFGSSRHLGIVSPAYIVARPRGADSRYLQYVLQSAPYLAELTRLSKWMPPSQFDILWTDLRTVEVPSPPVEEQRRIADFLDDRVARIDQIIAARQHQESLMAELLTSELEGLLAGSTARFGSVTLRRLGFHIEQGWSPEADTVAAQAGELGVLKLGCIRDGEFAPHENKALLPDTLPRPELRVHKGDLLITRANTPSLVGAAAVVESEPEEQLHLSDLIYRVRLDGYMHGAASAALRSHRIRGAIGVLARGTSGSMPKLRGEDIASLEVPRAPSLDQLRIIEADRSLREKRRTYNCLISGATARLAEYKQSLITAAVTGELDVTTASTRIPGV